MGADTEPIFILYLSRLGRKANIFKNVLLIKKGSFLTSDTQTVDASYLS